MTIKKNIKFESVDAFLLRGGQIQQIPQGQSGINLAKSLSQNIVINPRSNKTKPSKRL